MPVLACGRVYAMNDVEARRLLIETYEETGSLSETARSWHTSRQVVRKWVRRHVELGETGLEDHPQRALDLALFHLVGEAAMHADDGIRGEHLLGWVEDDQYTGTIDGSQGRLAPALRGAGGMDGCGGSTRIVCR